MYLQIRKVIVRVDNFDAMINMHLQNMKFIIGMNNFVAMINMHLQNKKGDLKSLYNGIHDHRVSTN